MSFETMNNRGWLYRALTFFVVPMLLLLLGLTIRQDYLQTAAIVWLALCGCYIVVLSILGITNLPNPNKAKKPPLLVQTLARLLGSVVWGGFFTVIYFLVYWLIFSRENLSPQ